LEELPTEGVIDEKSKTIWRTTLFRLTSTLFLQGQKNPEVSRPTEKRTYAISRVLIDMPSEKHRKDSRRDIMDV
jgi:hypothetical protein